MTPSSRGVSFAISGKGQAGASAGLTAEKNNHLLHEEQEAFTKEMGQAKNQEERFEVLEKYLEKSRENKEKDPSGSEAMEKLFMDELTKLTKFDNAGISFVVNPELGLHENLKAAKAFFGTYNVVKYLPDVFSEGVKLTASIIGTPIKIINTSLLIGGIMYDIVDNTKEQTSLENLALVSAGDVIKGIAIDNATGYAIDKKVPKVVIVTIGALTLTAINSNYHRLKEEVNSGEN